MYVWYSIYLDSAFVQPSDMFTCIIVHNSKCQHYYVLYIIIIIASYSISRLLRISAISSLKNNQKEEEV